jgi:hypothetical protein
MEGRLLALVGDARSGGTVLWSRVVALGEATRRPPLGRPSLGRRRLGASLHRWSAWNVAHNTGERSHLYCHVNC